MSVIYRYPTLLDGIHERFATVDGIKRIYDYEPQSPEAPCIYSTLQGFTTSHIGGMAITIYRVVHRVLIPWGDNEKAERELIGLVDPLIQCIEVDPMLDGRIRDGMCRIVDATADWGSISGVWYRNLDIVTETTDKRQVRGYT